MWHDQNVKWLEEEINAVNNLLFNTVVMLSTGVAEKTSGSCYNKIMLSCTHTANKIGPDSSSMVKSSTALASRASSIICACQSLLDLIKFSSTTIQWTDNWIRLQHTAETTTIYYLFVCAANISREPRGAQLLYTDSSRKVRLNSLNSDAILINDHLADIMHLIFIQMRQNLQHIDFNWRKLQVGVAVRVM